MKRCLLIIGFLLTNLIHGQMIINSYAYATASSFDADYQAILDEATSLGYTLPSSEDQITQNSKVVNAKASGIWVLCDMIFVFTESGDANFKKINWKNPTSTKAIETFNGTSGALVWSSTGVKGDGVNFLNLPYNPSIFGGNWTQNNAGMYANIVTAKTSYEIAISSTTTPNYTRLRTGTSQQQRINSVVNTGVSITWGTTTGLLGVSRNASTDVIVSENTTPTTSANTSDVMTNSAVSLFGYNTATIGSYTRGDMEIGYCLLGADMTALLSDIKTAFD